MTEIKEKLSFNRGTKVTADDNTKKGILINSYLCGYYKVLSHDTIYNGRVRCNFTSDERGL